MFAILRERLIHEMKRVVSSSNCIILLQGNTTESTNVDDTDKDRLFHQESNFHYLFGVTIPDCYGIIDMRNHKTILIVPYHDEKHAIWHGQVRSLEWYQQQYEINEVIHITNIARINEIFRGIGEIHVIGTPNIYTKKPLPQIDLKNLGLNPDDYQHLVRRDSLYHSICNIRVIKNSDEITILQFINEISSEGHKQVMLSCKIGMYECECAGIFSLHCMGRGIQQLAYPSIVGAGVNSAILHYNDNDEQIKDGDLVLCDMGAEFQGYASDITRTFPANGKFTEKQKEIYNIVLNAQETVIQSIKPGIQWCDMHWLSLKTICDSLYDYGFVIGDKTEIDLLYRDIAKYFMPHGIGHFMGKDVHDVGNANHVAYTRKTGTILQTGMVLTVEPGIYFIRPLLESGYKDPLISPYLNAEKISEYYDFGGIRIEDDIVVTIDGCQNLTTAPKKIEDIEAIMNHKI